MDDAQGCNHWPGQVRCGVCGIEPTCHCGHDGRALNSVNCPVHGRRERTAADAPCHYGPQEAEAWASGYNAALSRW